MKPQVAIPIRSWDGMERLATALDPDARRELAAGLAERVVDAALEAGASVVVVTRDPAVVDWAADRGVPSLGEPPGGGLDGAAMTAITATDGVWAVLHADLPLVSAADIRTVIGALRTRPVLVPSKDGGTAMIVGRQRPFPFRYGPGSFARHFAALAGEADVVVRPGLAIDIDRPSDLASTTSLTAER